MDNDEAPSRARLLAIASPMPLELPVTSARFPPAAGPRFLKNVLLRLLIRLLIPRVVEIKPLLGRVRKGDAFIFSTISLFLADM